MKREKTDREKFLLSEIDSYIEELNTNVDCSAEERLRALSRLAVCKEELENLKDE